MKLIIAFVVLSLISLCISAQSYEEITQDQMTKIINGEVDEPWLVLLYSDSFIVLLQWRF